MSFVLAALNFREPINAWSHCLWLLLSIPATMFLCRRCEGDRAKRLSLLVFGLSLAACYAGSTLFHAARVSRAWIDRFDELDHIGIFILIAGSYTPVAWNLLNGRSRWATLSAAWLLSALGTTLLLICGVFTMFWSTCFYLVLGWGATICYIEMARTLSHRTLFPLLFGGILYTAGAVINLVHWPVLWPGVFGEHELFHLFVMAGSLAHFWFMLNVVAPTAGGVGAAPITPVAPGAASRILSAGSATSGRDSSSDLSIPKGYSQPLFLHASPQWGHESGD
jgi:hemolysin III